MIKHTKGAITLLEGSLDSLTPAQLSRHCTEDVYNLKSSIPLLTSTMDEVQRQVRAVIELTGCHQINPVLRRILYGATCSETVDALTWLFCGMWCITLLGFTMLSVRAGLFNSVIKAPRRKRQKEREKEFEEYREYMAEFYEDADRWQLNAPEKQKAPTEKETIYHTPTFETEETSFTAGDDDGDGSDIACFASPKAKSDDSHSSASSYESDYSSDSDDERSSMSLSMLVGRMFHARHSTDETQSQLAGMSMLSGDGQSHSRGILELQTPRRRRKHSLPAPYHFNEESPHSEASIRHVASPQSDPRVTPQAPSKPKRIAFRTKGANKES